MASSLIHKIENKIHKAADHTSPEGQHLAAIQKEKGQHFVIEDRPTPKPGPNDVLIEVHAIALNPVDAFMRDAGFMIQNYPAVLGSDAAGVIIECGSEGALKPGTRVIAFCPSFFTGGNPDTGAFQRKVCIPTSGVCVMPEWLGFDEAAKLPLAVLTAWSGWYSVGAPIDKVFTKEDKKAILIWGGSGSVGTAVVQIARLMGYAVYTTCSPHHHMYVRSIGAYKVFNYKDENVVQEIISAIKEDGMSLDLAYDAAGALSQINDILKAVNPSGPSKIASAIPLNDNSPRVEGVETKFVQNPADPKEREKWERFVFGDWLAKVLDERRFKPSPPPKLIKGGLAHLDKALDELKAGVSGIKLVLHTQPELK